MSAETKFSFRAWSNILPTKPPEALIEGILLRGRLGVIFAQPDNAKTFVAIGASLSIGTGALFGGRAVLKGATIYIAAEAAYDMEVRVPAWRILHPDAGEPLGGCYGQVVNFYQELEVILFIADLKKRLNGERLELLVIDTLTASMVGGNQDWSKDMTTFINNVKMVMAATGCAALIVHHAGWKETSREKGSIDLRGAADVVIETTLGAAQPDGSRIVTLTCRKSKSLPEFKPFSIALVPVTIDTPMGSFKSLGLGDSVATPASQDAKSSKKADDLTKMEDVLETILGNKATSRDWMVAMQNYGKGWSEPSFDRRLAELKKAKRITGGGAQGEYYSVAYTAEARAARGNEPEYNPAPDSASAPGRAPSENHAQQTTLNLTPLEGGEGREGGFGEHSLPSNSPHEGNEGSSPQSRKDENSVVSEPAKGDIGAEALKHLAVKRAKA